MKHLNISRIVSCGCVILLLGCGQSPPVPSPPKPVVVTEHTSPPVVNRESSQPAVNSDLAGPQPADNEIALRLKAEGLQETGCFGTAVSFFGDTLTAGLTGYGQKVTDDRTAIVFAKGLDGKWAETGALRHTDKKNLPVFASALVAGPGWIAATSEGRSIVRIYSPNSQGEWLCTQELRPADVSDDQLFGCSLACTKDLLVIGARQDSERDSSAGAVYVFTCGPDGTWQQSAKLIGSDTKSHDQFGGKVAVCNQTIVACSRHNDENSGTAYVFEPDSNGHWIERAKLKSNQPGSFHQFGMSVAANAKIIAVGEWLAKVENDQRAGAVQLFANDSAGGYPHLQTLRAQRSRQERFGYALALNDNHVFVGSLPADPEAVAPQVYQFTADSQGLWQQTQVYTLPVPFKTSHFGSALASNNDWLAVGDEAFDKETGGVFLYSLQSGEGAKSRSSQP